MKKIAIVLFGLFVAGQASAQVTACSNGTASIISASTNFIRVDVQPRCSANVDARYQETQVGAAVTSSSRKGKHIFGGGTGGGSVGVQGVCANSVCTAAQLDGPLATILAAAT